VHPDVVDRLGPGGEQLVQLGQVLDPGGALPGKLDQEAILDGPEKSFYFSLPFWPSGLTVDQLDAQLGAGAQQPRIDEGAAVIEVLFPAALCARRRGDAGGLSPAA
jgi:hypothetical protein